MDTQAQATEEAADAAAGTQNALACEHRQHELCSRQRRHSQQQIHLRAESAAIDQDETFAALGELVGELHCDTAAERVPDKCCTLVPKRDQQVAGTARVCAKRVVAPRLRRAAMAEQVRRDDREALGECGHHALPRGRGRRDPVNEHDHRTAAGTSVGHPMAVELDLSQFQIGMH